ncbi:MAG TPA: ATP-binding protein [Bacteroidota bacterium]|nr:ATP-binding protein [Bacteroidota bacterium]
MEHSPIRTATFLALDAALLVLCLLHLPTLYRSATPPFEARNDDAGVTVTRLVAPGACGMLRVGDRISAWDGERVRADGELEFCADFALPGQPVVLTLEGGRTATVTCVREYDILYLVVVFFVGIVSGGVGVFVLLKRPEELAAVALHWALVSIGASTMITTGSVAGGGILPLITRGAFFVVYTGVLSFFVFFASLFPRPWPGSMRRKAAAAFLPAAVLLPGLLVTHLRAVALHSLPLYRDYQGWFDAFHVVLIVYVAIGLFSVILSYRRATTVKEKKQLLWIKLGLAAGPTPFLFLTVLPELFLPSGLIPEEVTELFFLLIPAAFAISFVRYRALDIEVVIKRTTVYALVLGSVVILYSLVVGVFSLLVGAYVPAAGAAGAVGAALLFNPVRGRLERWVNRKFFRVTYDFRDAARRVLDSVGRAEDEPEVGKAILRSTDEIIPVERIAVLTLAGEGESREVASRGFERAPGLGLRAWKSLDGEPSIPRAVPGAVEAGVPVRPLPADGGEGGGIVAAFPMTDSRGRTSGCIAVGGKKSGARFSAEDLDLMMELAAETSLALGRISLQRRLLLEQAAARRLEELNRLKSDFVSYVSHELRTPLTSIKMFAEILRSRRLRLGRTARGYVRVIEGESERLGRMVSTILDSARIESGVQEYRPVPGDLRAHVGKALAAMEYQLTQHRFRLSLTQPRRPLTVCADPDAVVQAVVNLVANAIKYAGERRVLTVRLGRRGGACQCAVRDRGIGIERDLLPHIFERFYRAPGVRRTSGGVGLGLPLVRHIMSVHGGSVEVSSVPGKGSTFTLLFPPFGFPRDHHPRHRSMSNEHHPGH